MKITFPTCEFCGADDPRICPSCGRFSCFECVTPPATPDDSCEHEPFEPIVGDNWEWKKEGEKYGLREGLGRTVQEDSAGHGVTS